MNPARMLKRAAAIGLTIVALTALSTLTHPTEAVEAAVLPDTHAGAPDIGYPCPGTNTECDLHTIAPTSGDVGYPNNCGGGCGVLEGTSPTSSGDIGYPGCPIGCRFDLQPGQPAPADVGYPGCPSSCRTLDTNPPAVNEIVAVKQPLNPSGWGDGTASI